MGTQQLTSLYNYSIIGTYWGGGSRNDCVGTAAMTHCRRRHPAVKKNKPKKLPGLNAAHIYVENKKYKETYLASISDLVRLASTPSLPSAFSFAPFFRCGVRVGLMDAVLIFALVTA